MRIDGIPTTIVGVLPEKFGFPEAAGDLAAGRVTLPVKRGEGQACR